MMDNINEKVVYLHRDKVVSIVSKNQCTDCKETQKKYNKITLMFKFVARQILSSLWWLLLPLLGCVALASLFLSYLLFGVSITGFATQPRSAQSYGEPGDDHDRDIHRIVFNEQAAFFYVGMDKGEARHWLVYALDEIEIFVVN